MTCIHNTTILTYDYYTACVHRDASENANEGDGAEDQLIDGEEEDNNGDGAVEPLNNEDEDSEDEDEDEGVDKLSKPTVLSDIYLAKTISKYRHYHRYFRYEYSPTNRSQSTTFCYCGRHPSSTF